MAVVEKIKPSIKTADHMYNSIEYITNPSKAYKASFINCFEGNAYEVSKQFHLTRTLANKNTGILSHHFCQSFSPDEKITPEQAHKIALQFAKKFASNYQVVVSTHIDKNHIHNHFIVNSVNPKTNKKFIDNKSSLKFMREESDKICRMYSLSVIDSKSKYKGIDQTTYNLGLQGKSWKVNLTKDLDDALSSCKTKNEFVNFLQNRNYTVKYRDIHITIQKNGEKKGIRVDTLAKQFGVKYSKKNIDSHLGVIPQIVPKKKKRSPEGDNLKTKQYVSEYEKYEQQFFSNPENINTFPAQWTTNKLKFSSNPLRFTLKLIKYIFLGSKYKIVSKPKNSNYKFYRAASPPPLSSMKRLENISTKDLKDAPGKTARIKIYAYQLPKLLSQPFFYSTYIDYKTGVATVYLKEKDLIKLSSALNLSDSEFFVKQSESMENKKVYQKIKNECDKPEYLLVTKEQRNLLSDNFIEFAWFEKGDKFNIVFNPEKKKNIFNVLFPKKEISKIKKENSYQKNGRINAELKAEAQKSGEKLMYKIVSPTIIHELEKINIKFASFRKDDGKVNIVFLEHDNSKVADVLRIHTKKKR